MRKRGLYNLSITVRTAIVMSLVVGLIFMAAGIAVFRDSQSQSLGSGLAALEYHATQVAERQEARFRRIRETHLNAMARLRAELAHPRAADAAAFDMLFPRDSRGGRRSADLLFDGGMTPLGPVRGIGAFIANEPDASARAILMAATATVHGVGEGARPDLESLYFFTPQNALIMFAADRPDRLRFYRKQAPSTLDFQTEEFATISAAAVNPRRETRCTALRHILYDQSGKTWTTGCMTPVDLGGRHVGTLGTSVLLDQLVSGQELKAIPGTGVILISREGHLIHHPGLTRQGTGGSEELLDLTTTRDPKLRALWDFVRQHRDGKYLGHVPALDAYAALRIIKTPGWYALVVQDAAVMHASSVRAVERIVIVALICLLLQTLTIFILLRREVGRPLRRLIERTRTLTRRVPSARHIEADTRISRDEVSQLTHDFDIMAERVMAQQEELEQRIEDRTQALRQANLQLKLAATRDTLTGISNQGHLVSRIDATLALQGPERRYLLLLDIDHLKQLNTAHGHSVGERALIQAANGIVALLREDDIVGRIGGEEFAALVTATSRAEAMNIAERVRFGVSGLETPGSYGEMLRLTVSIGVTGATYGDDFQALYQRASDALSEAKAAGRDRCRWRGVRMTGQHKRSAA